jgi:hypothetical protein
MDRKIALLGLLAFALFMGSAYSDPGDETTTASYCNGPGFVDADGDGVCDNYQAGVCPGGGCERGNGRGTGFVDEDGDGTCDYRGTACGGGCGRGYGRGPRRA